MYPRGCSAGSPESVAAGNVVLRSPSGSKIRVLKASDADIPVSSSITNPSNT
jgi:hypothetical protein